MDNLASLLCPSVSDSEIDKPSVHVLPVVNRITLQDRQTHLLSDVDMGYDADTDDWDKPVYNPIRRRLTKTISASALKLSPNDKYIPTVPSHSSENSQLGVVSKPPNVTTTLQQDDKTGTMNTHISSANEETVIEDRDRYAVSTDIDSDTHLDPVNVTTEVDSTHDLLSATQQSDTVLSEHAQDSLLDSQDGQAQGSVSDTPDEAFSEEPQDSGIDDLTRRTGHIMAQLNMSTQQVKDLQHLDSDLQSILSYLQDGSLPDSQKEARTILLEAGDYLLLNGLLLHSRIRKSRRAKLMNPCQIVLPKCLYQTVLKIYHESSLGSHGGINDTLDKVREYYFFKGMSSIIADFVKSCDCCQKRKLTQRHTRNGIKAFPTPTAPFTVWEADIYEPLPVTHSGKVYILTVVDMYSKFLVATPLESKDALSVATALYHVFTLYGVCETLITDNGTEFMAKVTQHVCRLLGMEVQQTPPYTHHCLGACERTHSTLAERMTPLVKQEPHTWEQYLPGTVFAMNSAVNSGTGYSPYEIIFGSRPRFPLNPTSQDTLQPIPQDCESYVLKLNRQLRNIREQVEENVRKSQENMVRRMNSDIKVLVFEPGDYVYCLRDPTGPGKKLQDKYQGPYLVHEVCSDHTVKLRDPNSNRVLDQLVHVDRTQGRICAGTEPASVLSRKSNNKGGSTYTGGVYSDRPCDSDRK